MKRLLTLVAFFATVHASAQQVNPVPDYVFRNQMSVGRGTVTDTAAYFSIGPRYGAVKGFMPPIVVDTAIFSGSKRNGLLIFSVQKNKFLYWDSVRVQWSDMAGSSGSYITGTGITGYLPQFSASTTLDTSALFTLGNRLGIGTSTFAYNSTNTANMELNGTAGGILGFKRNDSARGYLWHTGDNMELANTAAGSISFNTNSATRGSISSAGVWRLHNLAGTGDRVVVASSNGTLSASTSVTGLVDTTTISTRAWRQKGLDSLAALEVSGSGTTNYVPKFTASGTIGNSQIFDNGTSVSINTTAPAYSQTSRGNLTINGNDAILAFKTFDTNAGYLYHNGTSLLLNNALNGSLLLYTNDTERLRITSGGDVGIGTSSPMTYTNYRNLSIQGQSTGAVIDMATSAGLTAGGLQIAVRATDTDISAFGPQSGTASFLSFRTGTYAAVAERMRIFGNGRIGINTTTDAGYQLDINGTLRSVNGANFATTSGNVGVGTASPLNKLHVEFSDATAYSPSNTLTAAPIAYFYNNTSADAAVASTIRLDAGNLTGNNAVSLSAVRTGNADAAMTFGTRSGGGSVTERARITSSGELLINTTSDAGDYKLQVAGNIYNTGSAVLAANGTSHIGMGVVPSAWSWPNGVTQFRFGGHIAVADNSFLQLGTNSYYDGSNYVRVNAGYASRYLQNDGGHFWSTAITSTAGSTVTFNEQMRMTRDGELLINTTSDAGDYKLQVSGNALVTAGKLDITTNTAFGIGIARSGTSEVAGQIYNSNGILYLGAESSAGGQIFSGSSAYAAVIGSGANYPLQFATNNATRATINTNGELLINTTTDNGDFKLQVNGNALISGSIKTANGTSSTAVPWHLGSVVATNVQLDTANYVEVEINGTFYRLAIVTPL